MKDKYFDIQGRYSHPLTKLKQHFIKLFKEVTEHGTDKNTPQINLDYFCVHIVEHCNLNCQFCDHFAPLAAKEFADIKVFENDFARLSELLDVKVNQIALMGGEPLLHPKLNDFLYVARRHFPKTRLSLVTNGILLLKKTEDFWKSCRNNNIIITNTKYPIKLDFNKIKKVAKQYGVRCEYYGGTGFGLKTSVHLPLDLEGKQNVYRNFTKCSQANDCCFLAKGRLFTCTVAPNIRHFNNFFNKNLPLTSADYIDIYEAQNKDEIMHFLSKPIPFCKFCYIEKRTFGHKWQKSSKRIKEWTIEQS
ncbi:MAG: radical SAM protein [Syntrophomonas sp.]